MQRPLITLLTDFGQADWFVASMKGVILSIAPAATIVDITHEVPAHNILAGAYLLRAVSPYFPPNTVHLAVVDPGVGTDRRTVVVETKNGIFVGPDNGLLSLAAAQAEIQSVFWARDRKLFLSPVSSTFHGRDVFAPLAARLAVGLPPAKCGPRIANLIKLIEPTVRRVSGGVKGVVVWVDRFGNLITNLRESVIERVITGRVTHAARPRRLGRGFRQLQLLVTIGKFEIHGLSSTYGRGRDGELIALINSAGLLEIAARRSSAAAITQAGSGSSVTVKVRTQGAEKE